MPTGRGLGGVREAGIWGGTGEREGTFLTAFVPAARLGVKVGGRKRSGGAVPTEQVPSSGHLFKLGCVADKNTSQENVHYAVNMTVETEAEREEEVEWVWPRPGPSVEAVRTQGAVRPRLGPSCLAPKAHLPLSHPGCRDHVLQVPPNPSPGGREPGAPGRGQQVFRGERPVGVMSSTGSSWAGVPGAGCCAGGEGPGSQIGSAARQEGRPLGTRHRGAEGGAHRSELWSQSRGPARRCRSPAPARPGPAPRPRSPAPSALEAPPPAQASAFSAARPARPAASAISVARRPPFCRRSCVSAGARLGPQERGFVRFGNGRVGDGPDRAGGRRGSPGGPAGAVQSHPAAPRGPAVVPAAPSHTPPAAGPLGGPGATGRQRDRRRRLRGGGDSAGRGRGAAGPGRPCPRSRRRRDPAGDRAGLARPRSGEARVPSPRSGRPLRPARCGGRRGRSCGAGEGRPCHRLCCRRAGGSGRAAVSGPGTRGAGAGP